MQKRESTFKNYTIGYIFSIILTIAAFGLVAFYHGLSSSDLSRFTVTIYLALLAVTQFIIQVIFFLHLGKESKPKWNIMLFAFMLFIVIVLVGGSIWIMENLNYHHDTYSDSSNHKMLMEDEGIKTY